MVGIPSAGRIGLEVVAALVAVGLLLIVVGSLLHRRRTSADVDAPGLWAVTGGFGAGKTYLLALLVRRGVKKGRPAFANFRVDGAQLLSSWAEVVAVPDGSVVALAELHLWWPSDVRVAPPGVDQWVSQLRHHGITCLWDSQHWTFTATKFRKLTFGVWEARKEAGGHRYSLYTGLGYGRNSTPRLARMRVRRSREVMDSYCTTDDVQSHVEWVDEVLAARRRPGRGSLPF